MNASPDPQAALLLVLILFPVSAFVLFLFVGFLLSTVGGWRSLAAAYRAYEEPAGEIFHWRSMRLGLVNYNNGVNLIAAPRGLYFSMMILLRLGHPNLFIPWSEITATSQRGWILSYVELRARQAPQVRIRLPRKVAEAVFASAGQPLPPANP